jgi:hypothetical protein
VQVAGGCGSMSEMAYLTFINACAVEENNTRKWKRNQRIRIREWLKKRFDFSKNNLLREIKNVFTNRKQNYIYECSSLL